MRKGLKDDEGYIFCILLLKFISFSQQTQHPFWIQPTCLKITTVTLSLPHSHTYTHFFYIFYLRCSFFFFTTSLYLSMFVCLSVCLSACLPACFLTFSSTPVRSKL
ncbi:hypothetical protein EGW08_016662 [Elysia chlorotica]|uniref:Uncharacterized protein n=1 Tax=Elysia chlorotica TaxID=188477 RepID=A0A3S0ZIG4_ELYCH|nr:hypothetical protein EGW08_016662 [Elysia chlorotica]